MIWKQKVYLLLIWALITGGAAVVVLRLRATYQAETLIIVDSQKIPDKYVSSTVISDVQDRLATLSQEILSVTRLKKIIDDYNLYPEERKLKPTEEIVELMRRDVDVKLEKGWSGNRPGAFRVRYQGPNPQVVAQIANRLASLYIDENLKTRELQAEGTSEFLDAQLRDAKKTLDDLEAAVSRYKMTHNGELPQQETGINTALARLQTQLQGSQDAIHRAQQNKTLIETELRTSEASLAALVKMSELATASRNRTGALALGRQSGPDPVKRSQVLEAQLKALKNRYSDQHPEVRRTAQELSLAKAAETEAAAPPPTVAPVAAMPPVAASEPVGDTEKGRAAPAQRTTTVTSEIFREADQLNQRINALTAQATLADREIQDRTAERGRFVTEMSAYQAQLKRLPLREQEMAGLTRDYEISKANYRALLDKKLSADMAAEMERRQKAERFTVLDPAVVPERPAKPNRPVLLAIASLVGLGLGLTVAIGKEWNRNVLLGEWELPSIVPILGRIPEIKIESTMVTRSKHKITTVKAPTVIGSSLLVLVLAFTAYVRWRPF